MQSHRQRQDMLPAYYRRTPEGFEPLEIARSDWNWEQLHGVAVSGLLACGAEEAIGDLGREEFVPARFHVDLFRPAGTAVTTLHTEVVRSSNRLSLIDVRMKQGQEVMARATALFLRPTETPDGELWSPDERPTPPPLDLAPVSDEPTALANARRTLVYGDGAGETVSAEHTS